MAFDPRNLSHKISQGRAFVIQRDPFFASILMDMDPVIDTDATETCATDGERVIFNPDWLLSAERPLVAAAMRKMSLHVALSHHLRRGPWRDPNRWRAACDQAALHIMQTEGVDIPTGATALPQFHGMTAEEIYKHMEDDDQDDGGCQGDDGQGDGQGGEGSGQGQGQPQDGPAAPQEGNTPGSDGAVGQALDGADMRNKPEVSQKQAENDQRVMRAAMAEKAQGHESGLSKDLVDRVKAKGVDWRDRFMAFIDDKAEVKVSWAKPNRRFVGEDIYLPGKTANGIGTMAFIVDTSGSMSTEELAMCVTQIEAAREAIGIRNVVVIQIDTEVKAVDEYDMTEPLPTDMEFHGRGGTNMTPAFEAAAEHDPALIVMMTDGVFSHLTEDPGIPTLFALTHGGYQGKAPATFGDFIDLPAPEVA